MAAPRVKLQGKARIFRSSTGNRTQLINYSDAHSTPLKKFAE